MDLASLRSEGGREEFENAELLGFELSLREPQLVVQVDHLISGRKFRQRVSFTHILTDPWMIPNQVFLSAAGCVATELTRIESRHGNAGDRPEQQAAPRGQGR